jgi:hypothetical protein
VLHKYWEDKLPSDDEIYDLILGLPREYPDLHIKGTLGGVVRIKDIMTPLRGVTREMLTIILLRLQSKGLIKVMTNPAYVFIVRSS